MSTPYDKAVTTVAKWEADNLKMEIISSVIDSSIMSDIYVIYRRTYQDINQTYLRSHP